MTEGNQSKSDSGEEMGARGSLLRVRRGIASLMLMLMLGAKEGEMERSSSL